MANLFADIQDKRELDKLLTELRSALRDVRDARDTAKAIISRKIKQPEFVRTINRKLFPQYQIMVQEIVEFINEAKEMRTSVQRSKANDSSGMARPSADDGANQDS